jgi:multiple sugar transport system ATP-binding protein
MTVADNIGFGLRLRKVPRAERDERVRRTAATLGLEGLLQRKPSQLSGGQLQRVAMGRAMVRQPKAYLMDEPLSNLDAKLRVQMRAELASIHLRTKTTALYVTHDQVEAMTLGDRVAVLNNGRLQQVDTPKRLYDRPANLFVAAFMGSPSMNIVKASIDGDHVVLGGHSMPLPDHAPKWQGDVVLGVRPSAFTEDRTEGRATMEVDVRMVEELGSEARLLFNLDAAPVSSDEALAAARELDDSSGSSPLLAGEGSTQFTAIVDANTTAALGSRVTLCVDPQEFYFFDPATGLCLDNRAR